MKETHSFLLPDYYPAFSCKMGACRSACCVGWPISFSLEDYFQLLSLDCSPDLRRKLDGALHIAPHPTPEGYAQISPRFDGQCPLRLEDGRCGLHAEMGEDVLAAVCRLYPRGVRSSGGAYECSCANSCEAVVELLLHKQDVMRFQRLPLSIDVPAAPPRQYHFETAGREESIRLWLISQLQVRSLPLPQRLMLLGSALRAMDDALSAHDSAQVDALLSGHVTLPAPPALDAGHEQLRFGLTTARGMLEILDERSHSIRAYGEAALAFFGRGNSEFAAYTQAREQFERLVPSWTVWFEQLLVNHMFFVQFPFQDRPVDLKDEFVALCAVYTLLRFLCIGWTAEHPCVDAAVDVCAAAFRLIDHTEFDRYAAPILKQLGCDDPGYMQMLLCL